MVKPIMELAIISILAAVLTSGQADAQLVSTRAQCVAACGNAITETCGWITKRGKFNRCRAKLINQCKHFGDDVICPPPVAAAPPVTTPTTLPVVTPTTLPAVVTSTTTTVPYIPPTPTTLPAPVNPAAKFAGTWHFFGTLVSNTCAYGTFTIPSTVYDTLSLTVYPDTSAGGYLASGSAYFSGGLDTDGSMTVAAEVINGSGCIIDYGLALAPFTSGSSSTGGGMAAIWYCPGLPSCQYGYSGVWSR